MTAAGQDLPVRTNRRTSEVHQIADAIAAVPRTVGSLPKVDIHLFTEFFETLEQA
jgi:hypothetical protein